MLSVFILAALKWVFHCEAGFLLKRTETSRPRFRAASIVSDSSVPSVFFFRRSMFLLRFCGLLSPSPIPFPQVLHPPSVHDGPISTHETLMARNGGFPCDLWHG
ncbi:hypothetical protein F5148DRAFT_475468 [Russula earlei]|uniref:Uncharacterized protein n=1 Tax=Russula earlei TaxID=71964 RepID=A0ACC0TY58_9AGAM|nr:hypothetical protein F5148DRAFT_475468 [Russula earlei]